MGNKCILVVCDYAKHVSGLYVLFVHREVPQAKTGFSLFELLYGRAVRGLLDILKETWEAEKESEESVVSYILSVQEKLAGMMELVKQNSIKAKAQQKAWYDRNARERELQPGEQVLVLLPTCTSKLLVEWQGPYELLRKVGKVNYEVFMTGRRMKQQIFHINMLRKWCVPTDNAYLAQEMTKKEDDVVLRKEEEQEFKGTLQEEQV